MINPWPFIAAFVFWLGGLGMGFLTGWDYQGKRKDIVIEKMKAESASALAAATKKVLEYERGVNTLKDTVEKTHAQNTKRIDELRADNERLARAVGGLRDPFWRWKEPLPSNPGAPAEPQAAATGGQFSAEVQEFLFSEFYRADQAAEYARACYEWANKVAKVSPMTMSQSLSISPQTKE